MKKNPSLEANLKAAKTAIHEMMRHWHLWKRALEKDDQEEALAGYVAALTCCKVFIENYLKHLYPHEKNMPLKVSHDIKKLISEFDVIEKANEKKLHHALTQIDMLSKDAA